MSKVLVSFDDVLLKRIDRGARSKGVSRSAYLARLAELELTRNEGQGSSPAAARALADLDDLVRASDGAGDSTSAIRAERDAR